MSLSWSDAGQPPSTVDSTEIHILPDVTSLPSATVFVGRQRELARARRIHVAARGGSGTVLTVVGEAGIGKTRFAFEVAAEARRQGMAALRTRAIEGDWQPPYRAWSDILEQGLLDVLPPDIEEAPDWAAPLLALVPVLARRFPLLRPPAALSSEQERYRLSDAVVRCLSDLARRQPLVLVLDDVQWCDAESLWLLRHVAHAIRDVPVVVLVLVRDDHVDANPALVTTLATLHRVEGFDETRLRGLDPGEVGQLVGDLAEQPVSPDVVRMISDGTRGNPFFVQELTRHLHDQGHLAGGDPAPDGEGEFPVPESMRQVVDQRLERLTAETRRMLRLAAVCTDGFDFRILSALTGLDEERLLDAIDESLDAHLIVPMSGQDERYDFLHALIRRALYDSWSPSRRVRLHRQLAESLEQIHGDRVDLHAAELASHFHISVGLPGAERGVRHALTAAATARRAYAPEQAATYLRVAWDLAAALPVDEQVPISAALAIAESDALWLDAALVTIDRTLRLHGLAGVSSAETARFLATVVTSLHDGGASAEHWLPLVHRGLALVAADDELTWACLTLMIPRWEPVTSGIVNGSRWLGSDPRAVAIARASGDEQLFARSLQPWDLWERAWTESLWERVQTWQDPEAIIRTLTVGGADWLYLRGDFRRAIVHFQYLLSVSERNGSVLGQAEATVRLALVHAALGNLAEARAMRARAIRFVTPLGPGHRLHASMWWVDALLAETDGAEWGPIADYFVAYVADPTVSRRTTAIDDAALAALALARVGRPDRARQMLDPLSDVIRRAEPRMWLLNGAVGFGAAAVWALRAVDLAPTFHDAAQAIMRVGHDDFPGASNHLTVTRMAILLGDTDGATAAFTAARRHLDHSGQRPLRAMADLDEATWIMAAGGDPGHGLLLARAAMTAFEGLGMATHVALAGELLTGAVPVRPGPVLTGEFPAGLSAREADVVRLVVRGLTDRQIGEALFVSPRTVHAHIRNILAKTGRANRTELSVWAVDHGLASTSSRNADQS